ncbi:hypothetical protein QZM52_34975 [Burkholderia metallica]|uniref:Uncharacterized protein n=1 Tax=Burkholderia metallica TaxID=488729 RepID=A0ABT8PNQ7_9BURK|nr:hypothetical protein [Burkholderia metallica]MDN7936486.1 hypothetical protein [Burkholderia metallica]
MRHATAHFQEMRASAWGVAGIEIDGDAVMETFEIDKTFVRFQQGDRPDNGIGERYHDSGRTGAMTVAGRAPAPRRAGRGRFCQMNRQYARVRQRMRSRCALGRMTLTRAS